MRILMAMSGGVDSAAAATLLKRAGHTVEGCTMRLAGTAREDAECERAAASAKALGIPHRILDLRADFEEAVIRPFAAAYRAGKTPNPCIFCNAAIKFGAFYEYAMREGFDRIATGHYARIEGTLLKKAADPQKDQSYVLYRLRESILARTLLPLGGITKAEARSIAEEAGLASARAEESQDICFVPDGDYAALVEYLSGVPAAEGSYIDSEGHVLGKHRGIIHYTLGQHKGLGIALGRVRYVTHIDPIENTVTLGDEADLYTTEATLTDLHFIGTPPSAPHRAAVKLRYRQREVACTVYPEGDTARLVLDTAQRAPTPGQSAVLYDGDTVLGGGYIL